jgi:hypothetical protein
MVVVYQERNGERASDIYFMCAHCMLTIDAQDDPFTRRRLFAWIRVGCDGYAGICTMVPSRAFRHCIRISLESLSMGYRTRRGYRDVPVDEDAQVLHFEDEE